MTGVALVMGRDARRNRQRRRGAAAEPAMTGGTSVWGTAGAGIVLGMVEFDVEILLETGGKRFSRWVRAIDVRMTNPAHRRIRREHLGGVAMKAGFMSRKSRSRE